MSAASSPSLRTGVLAGLLATAAGDITAAATRRGRSPSSGLVRGLVDVAPGSLVDGGVALVGRADKPGLTVLATGVSVAAATGSSALARRRPLLGAVLAASPHVLGGWRATGCGDSAAPATVAAAGVAALVSTAAVAPVRVPARTVVSLGAAGALAALVVGRAARWRDAARRQAAVRLPAPAVRLPELPAPAAVRHDGVAPVLAEPGEFPVIDITVPEPRVDVDSWRLRLDGEVAAPVSLSLPELLALPLEERDLLLVCVHNPVGGSRMACARWIGIGVNELLELAGVVGEDGWLLVEAVDGYTNVLPLADARANGFLALGIAGQPLPRGLGSPARLLVAGRHGQDGNLKWVRRIAVTSRPPQSYWGRRGWGSGSYPVRPGSRIDAPGAHARLAEGVVTVRGYAWAPPIGVSEVQVQVDGGAWLDAALAVDLGPNAWRPWSLSWEATPGEHELRARCRTARGDWQEDVAAAPFPHGPQGIHSVRVHVAVGSAASASARRAVDAARARAGWTWASLAAWRESSDGDHGKVTEASTAH